MNKDLYILLIYKKMKGEISAEEMERLSSWLAERPEHRELEKKLQADWELGKNYEPTVSIDLEQEFSLLERRIEVDDNQRKEAKIVSLRQGRKIRWAVAASVAILVLTGIGILNWNAPASSWTVLETKEKEEKSIKLTDGTMVWLNENSRLEYPTPFSSDKRNVKLQGEAFFEVAKNAEKPFIVETTATTTTVLGTSFNLQEKKGATAAKLTLYTGKVLFEDKTSTHKTHLTPDQSVIYHIAEKRMEKLRNGSKNANSWQTKVLEFRDTPLEEVIVDLENHFGVEISFSVDLLKDCRYNVRLSNPSLTKILKAITQLYKVTVEETAEGKFELRGGSCPN